MSIVIATLLHLLVYVRDVDGIAAAERAATL
jgi:hypothetical protein